jgi:hypothetical protein
LDDDVLLPFLEQPNGLYDALQLTWIGVGEGKVFLSDTQDVRLFVCHSHIIPGKIKSLGRLYPRDSAYQSLNWNLNQVVTIDLCFAPSWRC